MKNIISAIAFLISINSFAQELLPTSTNQVIKHSYYTLSYNETHEQAEWVYYMLTKEMVQGNQPRKDSFKEDPFITTSSATLKDYKGSGYDRGHLCPAADMKMNSTSMSESFYMSNMSPQVPSFNRGIWKKLEAKVRDWALVEDTIYVVTGGVLMSSKGSIGANKVTVPKYYYKVIYDPTGDEKMIALILPNEKSSSPLSDFVVSVDSVEKMTGIDFFPDIDDEIENKLEAKSDFSMWAMGVSTSSSTSKVSGGTSTQCKGIAKSTGQRCKNKTTNANGYCYLHQSQSPDYVKPKATSSSPDGRCQAITKAGTRCKRKAAAGSKYCWQHK